MNTMQKTGYLAGMALLVAFSGTSIASPLSLPDMPLFLPDSVPPLNMIVLGRDHKLYYEAYNDHSDLDEDGTLDIGYRGWELKSPAPTDGSSPYKIDYYGYFDSFKCYTYSSANSRFEPSSTTVNKQCSGKWSGDFLNYLTTSRIDALRKVLYGGLRSTDGSTTVLARSHIPQDAHSWGKEYRSVAVDGYDISKYTPLALPSGTGTRRHLFANVSPLNGTNAGQPLLRVLENRTERIWEWVSTERAVAGTCLLKGQKTDGTAGCNAGGTAVTPTDYIVRVQVCASGLREVNCQKYGSQYKPTGLLQEFGENDSMYFGLISGSYAKNTSGGVLRRSLGSIKDEIDLTNGRFKTYDGIITSLNRLRATGFGGAYQYGCGWVTTRAINEGECQMWGNPVAEMMYEGLRYFAGKGSATTAYATTFGEGEEADLPGGGLPVATWDNPYSTRPVCSKPFETVVSDINTSYDTDQLPGSYFSTFSGDLTGLNVADIGQQIWNEEIGGSGNYFIGESAGVVDGAPTSKVVTSFGNIRGLSPEEPTKQGGYYAASVAHFGKTTDLNSVAGKQNVNTFAVALASPLPHIEIPVNGKKVTLVPFAKSVAGSSIDANGNFQPTDQIVDFYVDTLTSTSGKFRVSFEDVEQGADHDMDAIAIYEYNVVGTDVEVKLTSEYAFGGITQHMGYVISGTTHDGIYLDILDKRDGDSAGDTDYKLDTPPSFTGTPPAPSTGTGKWNDGAALPFTSTRTFSPGSTTGASLLKDPLWYAAKWGGYDESFKDEADRNDIPDDAAEWDEDGDGTPDNYFLVTNALKLSNQLRKAFQDILRKTTSSSSASVNSGSISSDTRVFQAKFNTGEWTGELLSYKLNTSNGTIISPADWEASKQLPAAASRQIITLNSDGTPVKFRWDDLDSSRQSALGNATVGPKVLNYLRGDGANEGQGTTQFRERRTKLGDIVSSSPLFVARPPFRYRDSLEPSSPYSKFVDDNATRMGMVYAGANDGMLHGFSAETGDEVFGYIPSAVFSRLPNLASQSYSHQFYVDGPPSMGDAYFDSAWHTVLVGGLNKGGQGIYALDITDPASTLKDAESNASDIALWEFTDLNDADLGYTYSQPTVVKLHNGKWGVIFGNGYNSTTADGHASVSGNAVLFIKELGGSGTVHKIDTGVGTAQATAYGVTYDNGLSTPALVDIDGDRVVDYAYAGDLYGNMWKFDLSSTSAASWDVAYKDAGTPQPLYKAKDSGGNAQPITVRPEVGRGPGGAGTIVLFGTGKYLEAADKLLTPQRVQTFYGIVDRNAAVTSLSDRSNLTKQEILAETNVDLDASGPLAPINVRVTTDNLLGANAGWYIDLLSPLGYQGEKQVSNPIIRNGNVVFTTLIPDKDPCNFGGGSWIMEMNLLDGARLKTTPFDLNNDGLFTDADQVTVTITDKDGNLVNITAPVTGLGSSEGILQSPGVVEGEQGEGKPVQYKYLPGSSGGIQRVIENPGVNGTGRQSWRQIR